MPFSDFEVARLTRLLTARSAEVPAHVRDRLRHGFRIGASDVVIFESRPHFRASNDWIDHDIAKFRFVQSANEWRLFCKFRNGRWRAYEPLPGANTFDELFAEVRRDPTCIFWG